MKAFKVFNEDWTCKDFQYKVGKTYEFKNKIELCSSGFHACLKLIDCFSYYNFDRKNKVAEVEILGEHLTHDDDSKVVTNKIKIVKELTWIEVLDLVNTGKNNTGNRNSGYCNSGDRNSGDWNSCDFETGYFNSKKSEYVNVFNKPCERQKWDNAEKPDFIYKVYTTKTENDITVYIDYKEAWQIAFKKATTKEIELLKALPNFDADVFYEITGIRL